VAYEVVLVSMLLLLLLLLFITIIIIIIIINIIRSISIPFEINSFYHRKLLLY